MMLRFAAAAILLSLVPQAAAGTFLAGSGGVSPPPFTGGFTPLLRGSERAFPFAIDGPGTFRVDELQVVLSQFRSQAGGAATFDIRADEEGQPGDVLSVFQAPALPPEPQVLSLTPLRGPVDFDAGETFWLVGGGAESQVNWHHGASALGPRASRRVGDAWRLSSVSNTTAFALLGTRRLPEPTGGVLTAAAIAGAVLARRRRLGAAS